MLRIIHALGGCGSTLLSRCLGVTPEVALLSEVNPASVKLNPAYDPLYQDTTWLHLLTKYDLDRFSRMDLRNPRRFRKLMRVFHHRAVAGGRQLIIRDYNYVEFVGIPFTTNPPRKLMLYRALPPEVPTAAFALIRHPVDQWLSLSKHLQPGWGVTPRFFCDAYDVFLRELGATTLFKYEEFVDNPQDQLLAMCRKFDLRFTPSFQARFHQFASVTGDLLRVGDPSISPSAPKLVPPDVMDAFRSSESYHSILERAGYSDSVYAVRELVPLHRDL